MMRYCPENITLSDIWIKHGVSICFLETVTSALTAGFILIFGLVQLGFYRRYATRSSRPPETTLFRVQIAVHVLLVVVAVLNMLLRHLLFGRSVLGFEVLYVSASCITWPTVLAVFLVERHFQLPTPPSHGHGVVPLITWTLAFISENLAFLSMDNEDWWFALSTPEHKVEFTFWVMRYFLTFAAFILGIKAPGINRSFENDTENLLGGSSSSQSGSTRSASQGSTWKNVWTKMRTLIPYMWPKKSLGLQLRVLMCVLLLVGVRVTNVYVPIMSKKIVDALAGNSMAAPSFAWQLILIYVTLKLIQGGSTGSQGLLNIMRSFLWIRVQQYTKREIQLQLFSHLHNLSLRWHLSRKTGEVLRVMDRGTDSINGLLNYVVFSITPTLIDIVIAIAFFSSQFSVFFGLIVFITMALYLTLTVMVTEWRTKFRREMNQSDNEQRSQAVDSLLNFETVKYYNAEKFEIRRYHEAILKYQRTEWTTMATLNMLNFGQSFVMNGGLLAGSLLCGYLVSEGSKTVGDYVLFGTYILQLMGPLNWLGTLYRIIQESFVNMENMLDLLDEPCEVVDVANAPALLPSKGKIEFRDVSFSYNVDRPILKALSFVVEPGNTCAIVGPTGSGKTTIMRLLFRFYDIQDGVILLDEQNIANVTQTSLRKHIGVVPQDTVLFNDSIVSNIRYAKPNATDDEVRVASNLADIHDQITNFPEGYHTVVGERGLKLSGGEKQRVAIARTLLKAPLVILLDEATSALDSKTERTIQAALQRVCANRTTLIIAHRLSTITHANTILVLNEGQIVERGRHEDLLLKQNGLYANMWSQQSNKNKETPGNISSSSS